MPSLQEQPPYMIHHLKIEDALYGMDIRNRHRTYRFEPFDSSYNEDRFAPVFEPEHKISEVTGRQLTNIMIPGHVVRVGGNEPIHAFLTVWADLQQDEFRFAVDRAPKISNMLQFLIPGLCDRVYALPNSHWFFKTQILHLVAEGENRELGLFDRRTLLAHGELRVIRVSGTHANEVQQKLQDLLADRIVRPHVVNAEQ